MSGVISDLVKDIKIPRMVKIRQIFPRPKIEPADIPAIVNGLLSPDRFLKRIQPGMRVCITVGSRGVANVELTTKALVDFCKSRGAQPFIIPAMGSHGGATAEGQRRVVESYGVTEEAMGCPIVSDMETVPVGRTAEGHIVRIDKNAAAADAIIVSCRIKPHTAFRGPYESGVMKMMAIGLGKQHGAEICHAAGFKHMARLVPLFGSVIKDRAPVAFAVAVLENAFDETCKITALTPDEFEDMEPEYLKEAFGLMPRILFDSCDVLIVDEIGKNFSGEGMDPNVTGTFATPYATGSFRARRVCLLGLAEESHGNAFGMGMASVCSRRLYEKADLQSTYLNGFTSTVLEPAFIPIIMDNDREAIQLCIRTCNDTDRENPRVIRIRNSLHIEHIMISEAMLEQARKNPDIVIEGVPEEMKFNEEGNLW